MSTGVHIVLSVFHFVDIYYFIILLGSKFKLEDN